MENPGLTAVLWLKKALYFWAGVSSAAGSAVVVGLKFFFFLLSSALAWWGLGLSIRRHNRGSFLFGALFLVYPLAYYVLFPHARYRHPIEPLMLVLIVYLFSEYSGSGFELFKRNCGCSGPKSIEAD